MEAVERFPNSPPLEGIAMPRQSEQQHQQETSASKISVPLQMFLAAVGTIVVLSGAYYQATGGIRSRMDVVVANQEAAAELSRLRDDRTKESLTDMKNEQKAMQESFNGQLKSLQGKIDLQQLQIQQLQLELAKGKR